MTSEVVDLGERRGLPLWARSALALVLTFAASSLLVMVLGASPVQVIESIVSGSVGSSFALSQTVITTGLLLGTALAAAIPFSARLWNVGGEGQMTLGAIAAATLGLVLPETWPPAVMVPVVMAGATAAGALFGGLPGLLKARFDASEIVTTLMLNFVAVNAAAWIIFDVFPEGFVQKTESIHENARLPRPFEGWLVDVGIVVALAAALVAWLIVRQTRLGFSIRAIGANSRAARLSGIRTERVTVQTFLLAGTFAGLSGALVVQGRDLALLQDFSANIGFVGIGVALVARLHPIALIPSAVFFAILRVGSNSLQAGAGLSPVVGEIVIATFVVLLMATGVIRFKYPEQTDGH